MIPTTSNGWIGVDLDGTLAEYTTWGGVEVIGKPVPAMVERVKRWHREGKDVRILTARANPDFNAEEAIRAVAYVQAWCLRHLGFVLPVTHKKDYFMVALYDDLAVAVERNTGRILGGNWPEGDVEGCPR